MGVACQLQEDRAVKRFLNNASKRSGHDGWALMNLGATKPFDWSVCTTRQEARDLKHEKQKNPDLFQHIEVVKVKINVELVATA